MISIIIITNYFYDMSELTEYTVPKWRSFNLRELKVDEAYLSFRSYFENVTYLYSLSDECYSCPYTKLKKLKPKKRSDPIAVNVAHPIKFKLLDEDVGKYAFDNETSICSFYRSDMREFGVYNWTLRENGTCKFVEDKPGVNTTLSIFSVTLLVGVIVLIAKISFCVWQTYSTDDAEEAAAARSEAENTSDKDSDTPAQKKRMKSLDAFRGIAIVLMIFVNSGGGNYWWIEHAPWNGLHLADVVFPSFLWIMGVCIPISVKSQLGKGVSKICTCRKIIWRSLKLFMIGLCLNSVNGPELENIRIMGVLQRFGIAYLVCGIFHTICNNNNFVLPQDRWKRAIFDIILLKSEIIFVFVLIAINLGITFGLYVPDCPRGYLGPGGKASLGAYPNCIGGATGYIDRSLLGIEHIYQHPTAKYLYDSQPFDPEGLFGSILTIVQVFFGMHAGMIILIHHEWKDRVKRWLSWCLTLGLLGGVLCLFSRENGFIPINKNLWSLSFVLITSALAFFNLSWLYCIIDVCPFWSGFPFVESGRNSIIMYVGHTILHKMLPWHWRIGAMNTHFILLLEAVWNTLLWIAIAIYLNFKRFYYNL